MKRKAPEITLEYTYEKLLQIQKDAEVKLKAGALDLKTKLFAAAAAHATDLIDASRTNGQPLDLTGRTEDNVFMALLRICMVNQEQKVPDAENKARMARKFGSYELFAIINSLNIGGKAAEIVIQQGIMAEPRLVIRTLPDANGVTHTFDPLDAAKAAVDGLVILDPKKDGALLYGRLLPFYEQFRADVLHYLLPPDEGTPHNS